MNNDTSPLRAEQFFTLRRTGILPLAKERTDYVPSCLRRLLFAEEPLGALLCQPEAGDREEHEHHQADSLPQSP